MEWVKQNLKIKSFLGTSRNAVLSQICAAMCYCLLVAYIKFQTKYRGSMRVLTRMIAAVVMEQRLLIDILSFNERSIKKARDPVSQLVQFLTRHYCISSKLIKNSCMISKRKVYFQIGK